MLFWRRKGIEMGVDLSDAIAIVVILGFCIVLGWVFSMPQPTCEYSTISQPIYSLERENSISGGFILGFGSVEGKPTYYFYKNDTKGIVLDSENAYYTSLVETNEVGPSIVYYDITQGKCPIEIRKYSGWQANKIMYVPEGTVKREFRVN
jgi:hypothetical protein